MTTHKTDAQWIRWTMKWKRIWWYAKVRCAMSNAFQIIHISKGKIKARIFLKTVESKMCRTEKENEIKGKICNLIIIVLPEPNSDWMKKGMALGSRGIMRHRVWMKMVLNENAQKQIGMLSRFVFCTLYIIIYICEWHHWTICGRLCTYICTSYEYNFNSIELCNVYYSV